MKLVLPSFHPLRLSVSAFMKRLGSRTIPGADLRTRPTKRRGAAGPTPDEDVAYEVTPFGRRPRSVRRTRALRIAGVAFSGLAAGALLWLLA